MSSTLTDRVAAAVAGGTIGGAQKGILQCVNVAGTDTVTFTTDPVTNAYTAYQIYVIRPANLNTGPVDVNGGGAGNLNLLTPGGAELAANDFNPAFNYFMQLNSTATEMRLMGGGF